MESDRIYAAVYLDRIEHNMREMRKALAPETMIIGTVKADGYGHGAVAVAKTIDPYVGEFAVATAEEALELKRNGLSKPVLILGPVGSSHYEDMIKNDIRMTVFEYETARDISDAACALGKKAVVHIAVDTGMSRIGLVPSAESADIVKAISGLEGISIEGIFTHFARADETDDAPARTQFGRFTDFLRILEDEGIHIPIRHCANSAAIIGMDYADLDAVRAGISIYGLYPSDEVDREKVKLEPAMEFKSFITYIKDIPPGTQVGYGGTWTAERKTRVATVSAGYGDGYPRGLSGKGSVLIRGKRAPILGRVCMDQFMVDVTDIPEAEKGDEVTLFGRDGNEFIPLEEICALCGGFHYEIPCLITKRVPRVYIRDGTIVGAMTTDSVTEYFRNI